MKKLFTIFSLIGILFFVFNQKSDAQTHATIPTKITDATQQCIDCHADESKGIYQEWGTSKHYRANVGCYECHKAEKGDVDAMEHNGFLISVIVSPKDCGKCHVSEVAQFSESRHAKAGSILGSLDNYLADVVEGNTNFYGKSALLVNGCQQCHGSVVKISKDGNPTPDTWPNTGIGRFNPDGSVGSCTACHQRHSFSAEQARRPETCGKCHLGPDHPQKEIFNESKHGIAYRAHQDDINIGSAKWVLGEDYTAAPTCATCHMSAVRTKDGDFIPVTHDVGKRISWNNRPPVSVRPEIADKKLGLEKMAKIGWKTRRANMQKVCTVCHSQPFVDNFYIQYDGLVKLYNNKFGKPGAKLMKTVYKYKLISNQKFDDQIEWTWFEIWHHEGRRARMGASMMAPDYTHWHGLYEVGKSWYMNFVPELKEIVAANLKSTDAQKVAGAKKLETELNTMLNSSNHEWFLGKMSPEEKVKREKTQKEFKARYSK